MDDALHPPPLPSAAPAPSPATPACRAVLGFESRWWLWILAAILPLYLVGFNTHWLVTPDSAVFLDVGQHLAAGEGFVATSGHQDRIKPGLPMVLAGINRVFGSHSYGIAKAFILACALGTLALTFWLFSLVGGRGLGVVIASLLALTFNFYEHAFTILSDMPFAFGVAVFLVGFERHRHARPKRWLSWALMLAGTLVMAVMRLVFITFVGGLILYLLWIAIRDRRNLRYLGIGVVMIVILAAIFFLDPRRHQGGELMIKENQAVSHLFEHLGTTIHDAVTWRIPNQLSKQTTRAILGLNLGTVASVPVAILAVFTGLAMLLYRPLWGLLVLVFLIQWSLFGFDHRYFLAVQLLWVYACWHGACWLSQRWNWQRGWVVLGIIMGVYLGVNVSRIAGYI